MVYNWFIAGDRFYRYFNSSNRLSPLSKPKQIGFAGGSKIVQKGLKIGLITDYGPI